LPDFFRVYCRKNIGYLPDIQDAKETSRSKRQGFHYIALRQFPPLGNQVLRQETAREPGKIAQILCEVRKLG